MPTKDDASTTKKEDFPFDCCCPPNETEQPSPVAARAYPPIEPKNTADEEDESLNSGPAPPPPGYPHPEDRKMEADGSKEEDVVYYNDDEEAGNGAMTRNSNDPPAEEDEDGDVDWEEDQSVEIPPTNVISRMVQKERDGPVKRRSRLLSLCCCFCLLVVLAIILGAGFGSGAFGEKSKNRGDVGTGGEDLPDLTEEEIKIRAEDLGSYLSTVSPTGGDVFADPNSPQTQALNWLVVDDPLRLDPNNPAHREQLQQRFALVTLYFASPFQWTNQDNWLSEEVPQECDGWFGVTCNEAGKVISIELFENNLQGELPADISLLTSMTELNIANNNISGELPASLSSMSSLEVVLVDRNLFEQDLSDFDFSGMPNLEVLWLSDNSFSGTIPQSILNSKSIEVLVLDNNEFTGGIDGISGLENALRITMGNNGLSGELPAELGTMTNLEVLWLFDNNFSGEMPEEIADMTSLSTFDVVGNDFSGPLPLLFVNMPGLQTLHLGENGFTGAVPAEYGTFPALTGINIEGNQLSGSLADSPLQNLPLTMLRVGDNNWDAGEIPAWVYTKTSLTDLRMPNANLVGPISTDLANLSNLRVLWLYGPFDEAAGVGQGGLTGNIPSNIDALTRLNDLRIYGNQLTGPVPEQLGFCENLLYVDIEFNQFTGNVPVTVVNWGQLEQFYLAYNDITGQIPQGMCQIESIIDMVPDCEVSCACCTDCVTN